MPGIVLLATAYLPPIEYFSFFRGSETVYIEREENYIKQTYRNRCCILTSNGIQILSVPVYQGSFHKTALKDIKIDYSKRWQQVHLRAIRAAYGSSPFFLFYYDWIEKLILKNHTFLLDLNYSLTGMIAPELGFTAPIRYTDSFEPEGMISYDHRYDISPKRVSSYLYTEYIQVFRHNDFTPGLSIIDLLFNTGPEAVNYL